MNFNQFVLRNTLRNKHLYLAYFLSTLFSVMTFFTFSTFAYHPMLQGLNGSANKGMLAAAIIIYIFSFIFVLYSMDVFLQSRKKEFGTLIMQGMSPKQLKKMVFIENLVIGFGATVFGILVGLGFAQLILMSAKFLLHFTLSAYFPAKAIGFTALSFFILFLFISFFIQFRLPQVSLQELLKSEETGKGELKVSNVKAFLGFFLIALGYGIALFAQGTMVVVVMFPVIFLVILGTNFFFNQFTVRFVNALKKRQRIFWKKTNLVVFSDLAFRMKDNARSFFFVAVISTVAFAAIGTLYGFENMSLKGVKDNLYEYQVTNISENEKKIAGIDEVLKKEAVSYDKYQLSFGKIDEGTLISEKEFNDLAKKVGEEPVTVKKGEALLVAPENLSETMKLPTAPLVVNQKTLKVTEKTTNNTLPAMGNLYVIPDGISYPKESETTTFYYIKNGSREKLLQAEKIIAEKYDAIGTTYLTQEIINGYGPILFVGVFIGMVFFVSAGSFLYFRLYSDLNEDVKKFTMIYKLGLSKKELKKMLSQQVAILFFTPIIVSLIHGAVALTAMYHLFSLSLQKEALYVLGIFLMIQIIYYFVARHFYYRGVEKKVMGH